MNPKNPRFRHIPNDYYLGRYKNHDLYQRNEFLIARFGDGGNDYLIASIAEVLDRFVFSHPNHPLTVAYNRRVEV